MIPVAQMAQPRRWRGDEGFSLTTAREDQSQHRREVQLLRGEPAATRRHDERIADVLAILHP